MRNVVTLAGTLATLIVLMSGCPTPTPDTTATVMGAVLDATEGQPLEGAQIAVAGNTDNTDSQGTFSIKQVPVGSCSLSVSKTGYQIAGSLPSTVTVQAPTTVLAPIYMIESGYTPPPGPSPPGP